MRKTILVLGALMAVLMFAMVGARSALADTVIDTTAGTNSTICCFGSDIETWGQVITSPTDETQLDSFTFVMAPGSSFVMRGEVYAWDGEKATGPNLFESTPRTVSSTGGWQQITFDTGGVQLEPGQQYVLFVTVSRDYETIPSHASASFAGVRLFSGDIYPGGYHVYINNETNFEELFVRSWAVFLDTDLAFTAVFSASDSPTTKEDCKNGGYKEFGFNNQGQCIQAVKQAS